MLIKKKKGGDIMAISLVIDGQEVKLTASQKKQLMKGLEAEKAKEKSKTKKVGPTFVKDMRLSVKKRRGVRPLMLSCSEPIVTAKDGTEYYGIDLSKDEVKCFIKQLKAYARRVFPGICFIGC